MSGARWGAVLIASFLLAACYGSNGQTKDGQSHWLDRCERASECGEGRICACGVCTIACDEPAMCGSEGLCARVDDSPCEESRSAPERVCLVGCSEDVDCNASGIECRAGACVNVSALVGSDASASDRDADSDVALADAGIQDDVTTVIDLDLGGGLGATNGARRFVLADGAIIWETTTASEEDGYILRMDLESEEIALLARPPASAEDAHLEVQGDLLFYTAGSDIRALFISDGTESWSMESAEAGSPLWTTDGTHIYYVPTSQTDSVWRMSHDAAPEELVYSSGGYAIVSLALDAEDVYVEELQDPISTDTRVRRVAKDGSDPTTFVEPLRVPLGYLTVSLAMFVYGDWLISDQRMHTGIEAHALEDGSLRELTGEDVAFAAASSASGEHVYFAESTGPDGSNERLFVSRVQMSSGRTERLRSTASFATQITAAGGYLYWIERGRVLRTALQ